MPIIVRELGIPELVIGFIDSFNQDRAARFAMPQDSSPRPFLAPQNGSVNDFGSVPVFSDAVTLNLGVENEEGGSFGEYDIIAAVKRADAPPPLTLRDVWGSGDLPHARVAPASNGSWDGNLPVGPLPLGAYVSYSWRVPRDRDPTDDDIASNAFIGPAFLAVNGASYSVELDRALVAGTNVEARFQLPDENVI